MKGQVEHVDQAAGPAAVAAPVHVLVVDDERGILESLARILAKEGYQVSTTDNGAEALDLMRSQQVHAVLADIMMPKMSGIELLRAIKAISPSIEVVMMTAFGTVDNAVECMREGAYDFITKPLKRAIVVRSLQRALERRSLVHENRVLREAAGTAQVGGIVGQSAALRCALDLLEQAAPSMATMLLVGESGTGKELLARTIHAMSGRAGPFVAMNCAALPSNLLETELFGHERGAFTGATTRRQGRFERAHGGTLFLDEIGEIPHDVQVRLLRVLQEGEFERVGGQETVPVDVRVVAATHRNLEEAVQAGRLREDLYYRLNVIQVPVPPLRERQGDVPLLAHHFLGRFCVKNDKHIEGFAQSAMQALEQYAWPGNVRELENTVERAVVLCRSLVIGSKDLPAEIQASVERGNEAGRELGGEEDGVFVPFGTPLEDVERKIIEATLQRTDGDKKTAARLLGIAARTIYRKLEGG